jgi:PAS domain S-box-containing protein
MKLPPTAEFKAIILIVDDSPENLFLLNDILKNKQYIVRLLRIGAMVMPSVIKAPPDLILLDIKMPGLDGYEVCKRLKADERVRDIPVIFISAMNKTVDKVRAFSAGGADYITKPFQVEEVLARVETHLTTRNMQKRLEKQNLQLREKIDERKRMQTQLQNLSRAVEQSASSIVITDLNGRIEYVNPAFSQITGYSREEAVGNNPRVLKSGKHPRAFYADMWRTISSGNVWQGELINKRKNGERYWEHASISPVKDRDGKITHYVAVKDNITKRKKMEKTLRKAKEEAENANRAKSEFLANMSHEIRTPMNSVLGFLELTLDGSSLTKFQRRNLETVHGSAKAMLALLNDILDLSKLESGKLELENCSFDLSKIMKDALHTLKLKVQEKGLAVSLDIHPDLSPYFIADAARLRQILINLAGNAVKFTAEGRVVMSVNPWKEKNYLHFTVFDTGIGIAPDKLKIIFSPFIQADGSTSRKFGGTGLGTTISKQLAELMGGRIWAESELGKGSAFHFIVPMQATEEITDENRCQCQIDKKSSPRLRRCFKILLAEDIEQNIRLVKIVMERRGHTIIVARNGHEAVDAFQRDGDFDAILMDVHMPEMDGIEAARIIRGMEKDARVSIIALTASMMKKEREACIEAGMDAVVGKPVNFDELLTVMERIIPQNRGEIAEIGENEEPETPSTALITQHLPGVNIKKALRLWQNSDVYTDALIRFANDYRDSADKMAALLESGDMNGAYMEAHKLKGVSGNLCVTDVFAVAEKLDDTIAKEKPDDAKALVPALKTALDTFLLSVRGLEQESEKGHILSGPPEKEFDPVRIAELLQNVLNAIDKYNPTAVDPFLSKLSEYFPSAQVNPIKNHVAQFKFKNARKETLKLAAALNINIKD